MTAKRAGLILKFVAIFLLMGAFGPTAVPTVQAGPQVLLDLQESVTPDTMTITSTYVGDADTLYAFLIVRGAPDSRLRGVVLGYTLHADSNLVNLGFVPGDAWRLSGGTPLGIDPPAGVAVSGSTLVLGRWVLLLKAGTNSVGTFELTPPGGLSGDEVLVVDADARGIAAELVHGAGINASAPDAFAQESLLGYLHDPLQHALVLYRRFALAFPPGLTGVPVSSIAFNDPSLQAFLSSIAPARIDKVVPDALEADSLIYTPDGVSLQRPPLWRAVKITTAADVSVDSLVAQLGRQASIEFAERNIQYEPKADSIPEDALFSHQWALRNVGQDGGTNGADINASHVWPTTTGEPSVRVSLIDTGIDKNHVDLRDRNIQGDDGWGGSVPNHGTYTAGILGATSNTIGIAGIDWHCTMISEKSVHYQADGLAENVERAIAHDAAIINFNFGHSLNGWGEDNNILRFALRDAYLHDIAITAPMGNADDGCEHPQAPALYNAILTSVGGTTRDDFATGDCTGTWMDVSAPAADVWTTDLNDGYSELWGTSAATPMVSGVKALLLARDPSLRADDLEYVLRRTASDLGAPGRDPQFGAGRVDAEAALAFVDTHWFARWHTGIMTVVDQTGWYPLIFTGPPGSYPSGQYRVRRYTLQGGWGPFDTWNASEAWIRGPGTKGFQGEEPHASYDFPGATIVGLDQWGVMLQTIVYEVTYPSGSPIGWWPCSPQEARVEATVCGTQPPSGASPDFGPSNGRLTVRLASGHPARVGSAIQLEAYWPVSGPRTVDLVTVSGAVARRLRSGPTASGREYLLWDGKLDGGLTAPAGVYFVIARQAGSRVARKLVLLR